MFKFFDRKMLERIIGSSNLDPQSKAKLLEVMDAFEKDQCLSSENKAKALEVLQNVSQGKSADNEPLNKLINKVSNGQQLTQEELASLKGLGEQFKKK